jgi:hypothetical protein
VSPTVELKESRNREATTGGLGEMRRLQEGRHSPLRDFAIHCAKKREIDRNIADVTTDATPDARGHE